MARRTRGPSTTNRPFTLLAIVIIIFLLASSLLILIPFGMGGDDADVDDDVLRVTPGAEVSRLETAIAGNPDDIDSMVVLAEVSGEQRTDHRVDPVVRAGDRAAAG